MAVVLDDLELVRSLLNKGANCDQTDDLGRTPLVFATEMESNKVIEVLLDHTN